MTETHTRKRARQTSLPCPLVFGLSSLDWAIQAHSKEDARRHRQDTWSGFEQERFYSSHFYAEVLKPAFVCLYISAGLNGSRHRDVVRASDRVCRISHQVLFSI